jgi:DegV family protein with EDD domain
MSIRIVSDSTCDLPQELVNRFEIEIVPAVVCFGSQKYLSGIDIDRELFYRKLEQEDVVPTTSQPSPGQFLEAYKELASDGHSILVVTCSAGASGVYQSAMLAKSKLPEADIEVIDSMSVSAGAGLLILAAAQAIQAGNSKKEVVALVERIRERLYVYATVPTLKYLRLSGRVRRAQELFASVLDIKPILAIRGGLIEPVDKVRTRRKSLERVLELMVEAVGGDGRIVAGLAHANVAGEAAWLEERVQELFDCEELLVVDAGMAITALAGPGLLGMVAYKS